MSGLSPAEQRNIRTVCGFADCPERAEQFIRQGKTVSDVLNLLLNEKLTADQRERAKAAEKAAPDLHNRPPVLSSTAPSWERAFAEIEASAASRIVIGR